MFQQGYTLSINVHTNIWYMITEANVQSFLLLLRQGISLLLWLFVHYFVYLSYKKTKERNLFVVAEKKELFNICNRFRFDFEQLFISCGHVLWLNVCFPKCHNKTKNRRSMLVLRCARIFARTYICSINFCHWFSELLAHAQSS